MSEDIGGTISIDIASDIRNLSFSRPPVPCAMALIQQIQAIVPPWVLAYTGPLLIIACLLFAFGAWLHPKWPLAGLTYLLSLLTLGLLQTLTQFAAVDIALIGGICAPAGYGFLLVGRGMLQTLHLPRGAYPHSHRPRSLYAQVRWGVAGGCVGGVLGLVIGLFVSAIVLTGWQLLDLPPFRGDRASAAVLTRSIFDGGIYTFGTLGLVLGAGLGLGQINRRQLHERLLINAVIYSAMMNTVFKRLLGVAIVRRLWQRFHPTASSPSAPTPRPVPRQVSVVLPNLHSEIVQVTEQRQTLILRCRTYRSLDWIGMGFNGFYILLTLLIGTIALFRGTWMTLGVGISVMLAFAALWTWHSLTRLINYTTVTLSRTLLTRRDGPLFSFTPPLRIPLRQVTDIQAVSRSTLRQASSSPSSPNYQICAVLIDGTQVPLVKRLEKWEEALFVEESIMRFRSRHGI